MTDNFEKDINVPSKEITYPWVNIFKYGDDFTTGGIFYKSVKQARFNLRGKNYYCTINVETGERITKKLGV